MTRAYLLGAGSTFQYYHTAPLIKDFFPRYDNQSPDQYKDLKRLLDNHGINIDDYNVETAMLEVEKFKETQKEFFKNHLHMIIFSALHGTTPTIQPNLEMKAQKYWGHFIKSKTFDNVNDFFMTINYDVAIEREIYGIHGWIDLGLDPGILHNLDTLNIDKEKGISVYHLHGAMNWHYNQEGTIDIYKSMRPPEFVPTGNSSVIVPFGNKEYENSVIKSIWEKAKSRLLHKHTNELVIVGCSLNKTDKLIINLVKNYVKEKGSECVKIIFKESDKKREEETVEYYRSLFGSVKLYTQGLNENAFDFIREEGKKTDNGG